MGIIGWTGFGLLAGLVARAPTPGRQGTGCFGTLGWASSVRCSVASSTKAVVGEEISFGWDPKPFLLSVAGAVCCCSGRTP